MTPNLARLLKCKIFIQFASDQLNDETIFLVALVTVPRTVLVFGFGRMVTLQSQHPRTVWTLVIVRLTLLYSKRH